MLGNLKYRSLSGLAMAVAAVGAQAITFSNISVTDNLGNALVSGVTVNTTSQDIDFLFPSAVVGDGFAAYSGTIIIQFDATGGPTEWITSVNLSVLGALSPLSGVAISETVTDLVVPGVIAAFGGTVTSNAQFPYNQGAVFTRPSTNIRVRKQLDLRSVNTNDFDFAQISLVEQNFNTSPVPEPATLMAVGAGIVALASRRRKRN